MYCSIVIATVMLIIKLCCVGTFGILYGALTVLDVIVLALCIVSIYLTFASLQRACKLYKVIIVLLCHSCLNLFSNFILKGHGCIL